MKKHLFGFFFFSFVVFSVFAQTTADTEVTAFCSYGLASEDQMVSSTMDGVYDELKNGYYVNGKLRFSESIFDLCDVFLQLNTLSRSGSPYLNLQLGHASESVFSFGIDSVYTCFHINKILFPRFKVFGLDTDINIKAGKYQLSSEDNSFSKFGMESSLGMIKMGSFPTVGLESVLTFSGAEQFINGLRSTLTLQLASGGMFDESVQRLYDIDGSISNHGEFVLNEYAPQLFAQVKLNGYGLPLGILSAAASYALNGTDVYTGHSAGASAQFSFEIIPDKVYLPVGASFAFYEKNIDIMASATGLDLDVDTTDFRNTYRLGLAAGAQLVTPKINVLEPPAVTGDLSLSSSITILEHIYRNPLTVIGLAVDGQYHLTSSFFAGGGFILGTIQALSWETKDSVTSLYDDYSHSFAVKDNLGYEIYLGLDVVESASISLGFVNMKGFSMNYGLESVPSGLIKYRQSGSTQAEGLWETKALYLQTSMKF